MPDTAEAGARARIAGDVRNWMERAVIGLNLCPFAKAVHVKGQVHLAVTAEQTHTGILEALAEELDALIAMDAQVRETTLLIVPRGLDDFMEFNDLLASAERLVRRRGLEGVVQLASFHPLYQFDGTQPEDITNFTNRAPYPVLHLLREDSIDRAVQSFPEAATIYEANMQTMEDLGHAGWAALGVGRS